MPGSPHQQKIDYGHLARWFFCNGATGFRSKLAMLLVLAVFVALSEGISLWLIVPIFHIIFPATHPGGGNQDSGATAAGISAVLEHVPDFLAGLFAPDTLLVTMLSLLLLLVAAKTALTLVTNWQTASCQWGLMAAWTKRLLQRYLRQDYLAFLQNTHGTMLGNITIETRLAALGVRDGVLLFSQLILSLVYVSVLFVTNWQITLFQLLAIFVLSVATWGFTHHLTTRISRDVLNAKQAIEVTASESLAALRQIRASAIEDDVVAKFRQPVDKLAHLMVRQNTYNAIPKPMSELLVLLLVLGTFYYLYSYTDVLIAAQIPTLTLLIVIANRLFISLARLATAYMAFTASLPALELVATLLEAPVSQLPVAGGDSGVDVSGDIVFSDVSLRYPGQSHHVLDGLNLAIKGGQITVLIGPSGGGKSTIIDLLLGFIRPGSGSLTVDGHDANNLDYESVRKKIGYVSQEVFLFNGSIRENLLIHSPDATDATIAEACRSAHIEQLVARLPEGLDTVVGDRGVMLSGGERQRLAIAIALLRDPQLIIFDEATSALDPEAEAAVYQAIRELRNKTILVISHRVAPALQPHRVVEIQDGKARIVQ